MTDSVPKSRVTLTYDTRQPEGREKARELPFRLLVVGDLGGEKQDLPLEARRVRQLNGRNLGEVIKGLKIRIPEISLGEGNRKLDIVIDSISSFAPDTILRTITGQRANGVVDPALRKAWGDGGTAEKLWPGDATLSEKWLQRERVLAFQKSYQNSKTLRAALKSFSTPVSADPTEAERRRNAINEVKSRIEGKIKPAVVPTPPTTTAPIATKDGGTK
jgi:hypothetical protein